MWTCFHTRCLLTVYEFDLVDQREPTPGRPLPSQPTAVWLLLHSGSRKYSGPVLPPCSTVTSCCSSRPHSCSCFRSLSSSFFFAQPGLRKLFIVFWLFLSLSARAQCRPDGEMNAACTACAARRGARRFKYGINHNNHTAAVLAEEFYVQKCPTTKALATTQLTSRLLSIVYFPKFSRTYLRMSADV